jgi:hypothetical protein
MIQMRWLVTTNKPQPKLQFRQMYNTTVYAGMPTEMQKLETAKFEWSEWMDVPIVKVD